MRVERRAPQIKETMATEFINIKTILRAEDGPPEHLHSPAGQFWLALNEPPPCIQGTK